MFCTKLTEYNKKSFLYSLIVKKLTSTEQFICQLSAESWPYKKVKLPIIQQPSFTKGRYKFKAPCEVHLIGSYAMRTCIKPEVQVDLALQIPKVSVAISFYVILLLCSQPEQKQLSIFYCGINN